MRAKSNKAYRAHEGDFLVHYAGVGCEMDTIMAIARGHAIAVVEDNAHGLYGKYADVYSGHIWAACNSLAFMKPRIFLVEKARALLINDAQFNERAEIVREKGTDRSRFFRGEVDKHTGRYRVELSALGHAGRVPPRTTRTPRPDSVDAAADLGKPTRGTGFVG
jgi:dTDP-4-amino-4,6-dideoxygalactose transaminase